MPRTTAPLAAGALAVLALAACSKSATAPRPEHSDVATSMPDAASTPGAVGPVTASPKTDAQPVPTTPAQAAPPVVPETETPAPAPK